MRASYVLLAVAALLSACDATAGTKTQAGTTHNELLNRRALRLHEETTETGASEDDEERIFSVSKVLGLKKAPIANLFVFDDLNKMTRDLDFKIDRWKQWYVKLSVEDIRKELNKLGLKDNPAYKELFVDYINLFKSRVDKLDDAAVETAKKAGKKVHFGTNTETTIDKIDAVMAEKAAIVAKKLQAEKLLRKQQRAKKWWWS